MKTHHALYRYSLPLLLIHLSSLHAAENSPATDTAIKLTQPLAEVTPRKSPFMQIVYIPPSLDKRRPSMRTSAGGTRNIEKAEALHVSLLSPNHVARTLDAQPVLYWHLSRDSEQTMLFTLIEIDAIKPLVETLIESPQQGFHSVDLGQQNITLHSGKTYEWSVSLIKDKSTLYPTSGDIVEKAFVQRIEADVDHSTPHNSPLNDMQQASHYAQQGFWYDPLAMVMGQNPNAVTDEQQLRLRAELLRQIGLSDLN